ncbi:ABC transporter substrate-binding protein [Microlunatus antarcticus]|uniref:Multiple sugar transport system substrate-binding protein n=1 Tax=Microlunatus antarcticus TaxID=53388 RepID=A0A7W5P913_9ACTN|nr:extracellular solute-binding protein [Microlunatus antarcticus]MBB3329150.1 multiple sugar transport system substrate-binding protein [Microlunatus antarcticus]
MSGPTATSFARAALSRRTLLAGAVGAGALFAAGCGSGSSGGEAGGPVTLRMAWYGGEARTKKYGTILDSYQAANPTVTVKREAAEWDKYWERIATQTAARDLPDVVHFTNMQLREFASNGQLLELNEDNTKGALDLSTLDPALLEAGKVDGKLYSVPTGSLILSTVANLGLLQGTGVTLPEAGAEWTWDDFREQGRKAVAKLGSGTWFVLDFGSSTRILTAFMMSRGKTLFDVAQQPPSLGFERQDLVDWLAYWEGLRQDGIAPPPSVTAEQQGLPFEADLFAKEKAAVYLHTSNTLTNYQKYTKGELVLRRLPHAAGGSAAVDYFFSVSMAVPASSKNPQEAAKVISYFLNDPTAVQTYAGEFGPPGSAAGREILRKAAQVDGQKVIDFTDSEIKLGAVADQNWPRGGQQLNDVVLGQANDQVAFGKASPEAAADEALAKLKDALSR